MLLLLAVKHLSIHTSDYSCYYQKPLVVLPDRGRCDAAADRELQVRAEGMGRAAAAASSSTATREVSRLKTRMSNKTAYRGLNLKMCFNTCVLDTVAQMVEYWSWKGSILARPNYFSFSMIFRLNEEMNQKMNIKNTNNSSNSLVFG